VHEDIADQGGSLAAQAREHAKRARESRPGSMPRRCACAGLGGLRIVGLREPPRLRSRGAWPLPCQGLLGGRGDLRRMVESAR
jgi:hypothetical protein